MSHLTGVGRGLSSWAGAWLTLAVCGVTNWVPRAIHAAVVQDSLETLTDSSSFVGNVLPEYGTEVVVFNSTLTRTFNWGMGAGSDNIWSGIQVINPGGSISINDPVNVLVLGSAGIDMSASAVSTALNLGVFLAGSQAWNVGAGTTLLVGGTVAAGALTLTIQGAGNTSITGGLAGNGLAVVKDGSGTLALSSANAYTGATTVRGGGVLLLDFAAAGAAAPVGNVISAASQLTLGGVNVGGATLRVTGNPLFGVSQTFASTQLQGGMSTVEVASPGQGVTVSFGALFGSAIQNGALLRFTPAATGVTFTTTTGPGGLLRLNTNQMEAATWGLDDFAGVTSGGVITAAGSVTAYTPMSSGSFSTGVTLADILGSSVTLSGSAIYQGVRINSPLASSISFSSTGQVGGFLMTPNAGAINVTISGSSLRTLANTGNNAALNFWNNDTAGTLTVAATIGGSGTGYAYVKGGAGLVIFTGGNKLANAGIFIDEGELRVDATPQLGSASGTLTLYGGTLGVSASMANTSGTMQHPISVGTIGGGVNVLSGVNFTIAAASNSAIAGGGALTKYGAGTLSLANVSSIWTGGLIVSGGVVDVTATSGKPLGAGPVNVGSAAGGGTLSISGNFAGSNVIDVNSGGFITVPGTLNAPFTVHAGGTYLTNSGVVGGAVTLQAGATIAGTGSDMQARVVPAGVAVEPGTRATLGTINFQSLTLSTGSILNLTLQAAGGPGDLINLLAGGSLTLNPHVQVNLWDFAAGGATAFLSNGSYQIFSGVDVLPADNCYAGGVTQGTMTNFVAANFDAGHQAGLSATFSILGPATASGIWVTIAAADTPVASTWQPGGTSSGVDWMDPGNWSAGIPKLAGDSARFLGSMSPTSVALNNGANGVHLGQLTIDAGTNSGWTFIGGSGRLCLENATASATVHVGAGDNVIAADVTLLSATQIFLHCAAGSLTISGIVDAPDAGVGVTLTGAGAAALLLTNANTIAGNGTITAGANLQLGNGGAIGSWGSGTLTVSGNLIVKRSGTVNVSSLAGGIVGAGTLTQAGAAGQLVWDAAVASGGFTGTLQVAAGTVEFSGGVLHSIGGVSGAGTLLVDQGTTLTSDGVNLLNGTWTINGTQVIRSSSGGGAYGEHFLGQDSTALSGTSVASNLTFGLGVKLDLQNNVLIVQATALNLGTLLTQVANDVSQGYITSSTVAANPAYTLVVAVDNSNINATMFGGVPVNADSIIVTEALKGDANLDGYVDLNDFNIWLSNLGNPNSANSASTGDLNTDGFVDLNDFNLWLSNLGHNVGTGPVPSFASGGSLAGGGGLSSGGAAATPEPASLALLGLGAAGMLVLRKRRRV